MAFQYLRFSIGSVFDDPDIYEVRADHGSLDVHRENYVEDEIDFRLEDAEELINLIEAQHIDQWKESYVDPYWVDGIQWNLEYEDDEKGHRFIVGSNAYPVGWDDFLDLMHFLDIALLGYIV